MKNLKVGIILMVLGNILNLAYTAFSGNEPSSFGDFSSGLLLGLSIGCNLVSIILIVSYMAKNKEKNKK
ncbi:MAG TPA: hypothetical protein DCQ76_06055 [Ruminococcaceae bacterium]|nr:hypothetical protein [Oscillospiraceae bacterium]